MKLTEFLVSFQDILQRDEPVAMEERLADIEEWDSLSMMALLAWLDKNFDAKTNFDTLNAKQTVKDIADMVPGLEK